MPTHRLASKPEVLLRLERETKIPQLFLRWNQSRTQRKVSRFPSPSNSLCPKRMRLVWISLPCCRCVQTKVENYFPYRSSFPICPRYQICPVALLFVPVPSESARYHPPCLEDKKPLAQILRPRFHLAKWWHRTKDRHQQFYFQWDPLRREWTKP